MTTPAMNTLDALERALAAMTQLSACLDRDGDQLGTIHLDSVLCALHDKGMERKQHCEQLAQVNQAAKVHGFSVTSVAWSDAVTHADDARLHAAPQAFGDYPCDTHVMVTDRSAKGFYLEHEPHLHSALSSGYAAVDTVMVPTADGPQRLHGFLRDLCQVNMDSKMQAVIKAAGVVLSAPGGNAEIFLKQNIYGGKKAVTMLFMADGSMGISLNSGKVGVCKPDEVQKLINLQGNVDMNAMHFTAAGEGGSPKRKRDSMDFVDVCGPTWVTVVTMWMPSATVTRAQAPVYRSLSAACASVGKTTVDTLDSTTVLSTLKGMTVETVHVKRLHCMVLDGTQCSPMALSEGVRHVCALLNLQTRAANDPSHAKKPHHAEAFNNLQQKAYGCLKGCSVSFDYGSVCPTCHAPRFH